MEFSRRFRVDCAAVSSRLTALVLGANTLPAVA